MSTPIYSTPEYWNKRADTWARNPRKCLFDDPRFDEYEKRVLRVLDSLVLPGNQVLDVACGFARFAVHVSSLFGIWHGIDFSEEMRNQTSSRWHNNYYLGDALFPHTVVPKDKCFDLIFEVNSCKVLQMNPQRFKELYSPYLKRGGVLASLECEEFVIFNSY